MEEFLKGVAQRQLPLKLRLAATAECAEGAGSLHREFAIAQLCPLNASMSTGWLAGNSTRATDFGRSSTQSADELGGNSGDGAPGGPRAKMARVASRAETFEKVRQFEAVSGRANALSSCDRSLECVAAGVRRRGAFFGLRGRLHFPPTEGEVPA